MIDASDLAVLSDVGSIPTASFHEDAVAAYVARFIRDLGLPLRADPSGNLIAEYRSGKPTTPVALVAHLDHPAIEISHVHSPTSATATLLGGVRPACFGRRVPARIHRASEVAAAIVGYETNPSTGRVRALALETEAPVSAGDFGVFDLPGFVRRDDVAAMRAADDLAGVAAILLTLRRLAGIGQAGHVFGLFTRAEEVGLVGAEAIAGEKLLPPETIVVSLECSRWLPGAEPGLGPVIRVGDRTQSFHPDGEALLLAAHRRIPTVAVQRQLMSGGTCEATAFVRAGYRATGVALPLVNYHNVGPDDAIVPEEINLNDFSGEVDLLVAAVEASVDRALPGASAGGDARLRELRDRLVQSSAPFRALATE
jgi:endoglucanase